MLALAPAGSEYTPYPVAKSVTYLLDCVASAVAVTLNDAAPLIITFTVLLTVFPLIDPKSNLYGFVSRLTI